jgi:hypothetical protein
MLILRKFQGHVSFATPPEEGNVYEVTTQANDDGGESPDLQHMVAKVFTDPEDITSFFWTELTILRYASWPLRQGRERGMLETEN